MSCSEELTEYALGLAEAGVRDHKDMAAQLRADFPNNKFTEGDTQTLYNNARLEYAKQLAAKGNLVRPANTVFIDHIAGLYGRRGASKFISALEEPDGSNPLFDKVAEGKEDLTPQELERSAKAMTIAAAEKAKPNPKPSIHPLKDIQAAHRELQEVNGKPKATAKANPVSSLLSVVESKYGRDAAVALRKSLRQQGQDNILRKVATRTPLTEDEHFKAVQAFSDAANEGYRPNTKQLTEAGKQLATVRQTARDAAAEELSKARTFEDTLREWGYKNLKTEDGKVDTPKVKSFINDLSKVKDGNNQEYARIMSNYTKKPIGESWFNLWRAGLISNPLIVPKVMISQFSHYAASELSRIPAAGLDTLIAKGDANKRTTYGARPGASLQGVGKAFTQGAKGFKTIAEEGDLGLHARGLHIGSQEANIIPSEFSGNFFGTSKGKFGKVQDAANSGLSTYVRGIGKMHSASYYPGKVAFNYRDLSEQAEVKARAQVANGEIHPSNLSDRIRQLEANPTPEMVEHAAHAAEEGTFLNKNIPSNAKAAAERTHPVVRAALNWAAPISKVPFNLIAKSVGEYTLGIPTSLAELAYRKAFNKPLDPITQKAVSMRFGRGTIGGLSMVAGYIAKQMFPQQVIAPSAKEYDKGGVKVTMPKGAPIQHFNVATGDVQPTITPFEVGVLAAQAHGGDQKAKTLLADLNYATFGDLPGLDTINSVGEALQSTNKLQNFGAMQAASFVPGAVKATAAYTDKATLDGEHYRYARTGQPMDYVRKGIPGSREQLPIAAEGQSPPRAKRIATGLPKLSL